MRLGMSRNGMPRWFSVKIFLPLAKVLALPADRKNSIAIEVLYELLAELLWPIICLSSEQGPPRRFWVLEGKAGRRPNYAPRISTGVSPRGRGASIFHTGRIAAA